MQADETDRRRTARLHEREDLPCLNETSERACTRARARGPSQARPLYASCKFAVLDSASTTLLDNRSYAGCSRMCDTRWIQIGARTRTLTCIRPHSLLRMQERKQLSLTVRKQFFQLAKRTNLSRHRHQSVAVYRARARQKRGIRAMKLRRIRRRQRGACRKERDESSRGQRPLSSRGQRPPHSGGPRPDQRRRLARRTACRIATRRRRRQRRRSCRACRGRASPSESSRRGGRGRCPPALAPLRRKCP